MRAVIPVAGSRWSGGGGGASELCSEVRDERVFNQLAWLYVAAEPRPCLALGLVERGDEWV